MAHTHLPAMARVPRCSYDGIGQMAMGPTNQLDHGDDVNTTPSLKDHLAHLTYNQAVKLLAPGDGKRLLRQGGSYDIELEQIDMGRDRFHLAWSPGIEVTLRLDEDAGGLVTQCTACRTSCEHVGAALSFILEEKQLLGLSALPPERFPVDGLSETELIEHALAERHERAQSEQMRLQSGNPKALWADYVLTNRTSGKSYRVALRGWARGDSYCSCPDFRKNTLGTCKHILHALEKVKRRFPANVRNRPYRPRELAIHLQYGERLELRLLVPAKLPPASRKLVSPLDGIAITDIRDLLRRAQKLERLGNSVRIYPDAEEYIQQQLFYDHIGAIVNTIRANPADHPLRQNLLHGELLAYQLDGIAFAVGAGRAILADDMGLGKTIQGIGVAELLAREAGISRVLVVSPASLKSQWRAEIERFSGRSCQVVLGSAADRARQYDDAGSFFTICNYEQLLRDASVVDQLSWDLIILDEGQRIKNWEAKTSQTIKSLKSTFALVLSGTPLENRLDELHSIVEFVDDRRLGPRFRFHNRHRILDETGKILGYKNLGELRELLKPVMLRRTRAAVMQELPPRTTEIIRIPATEEQLDIHRGFSRTITAIVQKKFITEMDLLRLKKALLMCRLCANSTVLADKQPPGYSSKLEELELLIDELRQEDDRKIVLFSEWTGMLDLIEPMLMRMGLEFVRLDGSVPQKKRQQLVDRFQRDEHCRLFITTNAGSTGLNLQSANTVINVDLPWNPAVLEQRIARAHRMGQERPVQVFILVTADTLEENLLGTLSAKHELALAALDVDSDVDDVDMASGFEALKNRLEILLGNKPPAPIDESARRETTKAVSGEPNQIARAGGKLLAAAFDFLGELVPPAPATETSSALAREFRRRLDECVEEDENGSLRLTVDLPDAGALDRFARALAGLVASRALNEED